MRDSLNIQILLRNGPPPTLRGAGLGIGAIVLVSVLLALGLSLIQSIIFRYAVMPGFAADMMIYLIAVSAAGYWAGIGLLWGWAASWARRLKLYWIALVPGLLSLGLVGYFGFKTAELLLPREDGLESVFPVSLYVVGWAGVLIRLGAFWLVFLGRAIPVRIAAARAKA